MKTETFELEIITPCFCGGAQPEKEAEIRAPSIRGQLRWWFRTLGGFRSLSPMPLRQQEDLIFGSAAGDSGRAGKLMVRVANSRLQSQIKDGQELGHPNFSDSAYLTFPIQSREKNGQKTQYSGRGVIIGGTFELDILWRGPNELWPDVRALVVVFGHLGSLGFRGRRAMGALALKGKDKLELDQALPRFLRQSAITIKALPANSSRDSISVLGAWLRSCRSHGRSGQNQKEQGSHYFKYAKVDHDIGYNASGNQGLAAFRPALGLPIIQRTGNGTNYWDESWNIMRKKGEGRFASPVLLRPHRDSTGKWHALIIFVDEHKWPKDKQVYLNGQPRSVSPNLYEAMKKHPALRAWP